MAGCALVSAKRLECARITPLCSLVSCELARGGSRKAAEYARTSNAFTTNRPATPKQAMHVLISPDKFKGTLSAAAAAQAIARGWHKARPNDSVELVPMSDGGDGFGPLISRYLDAKPQLVKTVDAAHRSCSAKWWWQARTKTALIESAQIIGLALLPPDKFHPFELDTFGLGRVFQAAAAKGARRCLIGIGGSATNDGGFGLARSLGWQFHDSNSAEIQQWTSLHKLARIQRPNTPQFIEVTVAVDVQNRLLGPKGATRVYGPQKGLRPKDFDLAERCLRRLSRIIRQQFGQDSARIPGTGAAGGLGFGLKAFLGARLQSGFDVFAECAKLDRHLRHADLVITGEGRIDESTFMGKGVSRLATRCRELNIPCLALAGSVKTAKGSVLAKTWSLNELTTSHQAESRPAYWLQRLAERAAVEWRLNVSQ
jgi:glycerate kinase